MKLIDADKLLAKDYISIEDIENAPEVERRQTGKWIPNPCNDDIYHTFYKCSVCGRSIEVSHGTNPSINFPYCHCGADMRGEVK